MRLPAEHLNSILIQTRLLEQPNQPRYVRHKRINTQQEQSSEDESSDSDPESNTKGAKPKPNNSMNDSSDSDNETNDLNAKILITNSKADSSNSKNGTYRGALNTRINPTNPTRKDLLDNKAEFIHRTTGKGPREETKSDDRDQLTSGSQLKISNIQTQRSMRELELKSGGPISWLTDTEINLYLELLRTQYPQTNGLEDP